MLALLCMAGITALVQQWQRENPEPSCYALRAARTSTDMSAVDCGAYNATYKVALLVDSPDERTPGRCPLGPYSVADDPSGGTRCLMLDVEAGDCLQTLTARRKGREHSALARDECGPRSQERVTAVVTGPQSGCAPEEKAIHYSQPATTICLGKP
ncbi:hypothetical protein [Lentzea sp. NPDC060358]|uniref:LppU/SCO3897 family protein n=1 Tax=Lentzea sp. NPDC060358 TaxID=3347103 RepID=UPI003646B9A2